MIDEYLAVDVSLGDWPAGLPDDETLLLPAILCDRTDNDPGEDGDTNRDEDPPPPPPPTVCNSSGPGWVRYGPAPGNRAQFGEAHLTAEFLASNPGTSASPSIRPPGFESGAAGHNRGHLIAKQLGGSGTTIANLITQYVRPNQQQRVQESLVKAAVLACETVDYLVEALYAGGGSLPVTATELVAIGDKGFTLHAIIPNEP